MTRQQSLVSKKKRRRVFYLLIVLAVVFYFVFGRYGVVSIIRIRRKEANLKKRVSELEAKKIILEEDIKRILTDKKEVERLARTKLSMIKKGEKIIIIKEVK